MKVILTIEEMKSIKGGQSKNGYIYCLNKSVRYLCGKSTMLACVEECIILHKDNCGGCAPFPHLA